MVGNELNSANRTIDGPEKTTPPWNVAVVEALNHWQSIDHVHPFTCFNRGDGNHEGEGALVATESGWVCPSCDYTQDWAWGYMLYSPPNPLDVMRRE